MGLSGDRLRAETARESELIGRNEVLLQIAQKRAFRRVRSHANSGAWRDREI
jgi:hypothetical protein